MQLNIQFLPLSYAISFNFAKRHAEKSIIKIEYSLKENI
jgi:hypothetical protein